MTLPSVETVRALLDYFPETGAFVWRESRGRVAQGAAAGSVQVKGGKRYASIQVDGKRIAAHRVAWAHFHGAWPMREVDHIDGDGENNRIANLREVTSAENKQNQRRAKSHSATGLLGAFKWRNKFKAQIVVGGTCKHIGTFETAEEAHAAYVEAKRQLHPMCTI